MMYIVIQVYSVIYFVGSLYMHNNFIICITHFTLYRFQVVSSLPVYFSVEFVAAGVDLSQPVVATCGSGVTAAHIALAAHTLGADIPVYDVRYSVCILIESR